MNHKTRRKSTFRISSPHELGDVAPDGGTDDHPEAIGEPETRERRGAVGLGGEIRYDHLAA